MKREEYGIYIHGEKVLTKYSWNTARRAIPRLVRDQLIPGETAELIHEDIAKQGKEFISTQQTWEIDTGLRIEISMKKERNR